MGSEASKGLADGVGRQYIRQGKPQIVPFYLGNILPSKTSLPYHVASALNSFLNLEVSEEDFASNFRPVMVKMLLRSPEASMEIISACLQGFKNRNNADDLKAFLPSILSASKSSVVTTREKAVQFFGVVAADVDPEAAKPVVEEVLALLKGGKTSSPEQRCALYQMLRQMSIVESASSSVAETLASLLSKETNEASLAAALDALLDSVARSASASTPALLTKVGQALAKELQNAKAPLRKVTAMAVGNAASAWLSAGDASTLAPLLDALLPGLEANLKNASTNTLTSTSGPLEGYVAVSILEHPAFLRAASQSTRDAIAKNVVLQGLLATESKPSFLLSGKVHRKFASDDEQEWLLRALEALLANRATDVEKDEAIVASVASALARTVLTPNRSRLRGCGRRFVEEAMKVSPITASRIVGAAVLLAVEMTKTAKPTSDDDRPRDVAKPLQDIIAAAGKAIASREADGTEQVVMHLFLASHLPELGDPRGRLVRGLLSAAKLDARQFVEGHLTELLCVCRHGLADPTLLAASPAALSTLASLAPESAIAELVGDVEASVVPEQLRLITDQDLGIFATAPDVTFVDVLADDKDKKVIDKNRKDAKIEQWEAELRADLAKKKAAAEHKTLTKDQKVKFDAQLKVEAVTRAEVAERQTQMGTATRIIKSLVAARSEELDSYLPSLIRMIRELLQISQARQLAEAELLSAFAALCTCASQRLGNYKLFLRVALLRTIDEELVSEDFRSVPIREQVLQILYRLRSLSEQQPLDLASIALVMPFLTTVISRGGLGISPSDEDASDGILEQIQLAMDIIQFHAGVCEDVRFPRQEMIDDLVIIVSKHSQLSRDAVGVLRSMGEAVKDSALPSEIDALLKHTLAQETYVRLGALQAIQSLDLTDLEFSAELWLACHDPSDAENARLAYRAWEESVLDVPEDFAAKLLPYIEDDREYVRRACGRSFAGAVELHPEALPGLLSDLFALYRERNRVLMPEYDMFGMIIESTRNREDPWRIRSAIAQAFQDLAPLLQPNDLEPFFEFLIRDEALGDRHDAVRQNMLDAGTLVVDKRGREKLSELISRFEIFLASPPPPSEALDGVLEAVVILLGRLARHLSSDDRRIASIVERLLDALKTPSEMVQVAVADCLPALAHAIKADVPRLVEQLFDQLLRGAKYAERRGSAYGLAGMIKGRGLSAMAEFRIMERLADAVEDKASVSARQAAVECYGILAATLQRLFEPYIVQGDLLPLLIASFGDSKAEVRDATEETAKVIMQNVSSYCAKLMLPTLLEGLEEKQWRTKKGAIELLGAYSSAAPSQLAAALPTVIPRLSGVLSDAHPQVRTSGNRSLKQFGLVMKNPEVKQMVPTLLQALVDPTSKTAPALQRLLSQTFAHYLDAPSLALVVPIVDRGLRDRSAQIQRDGAKITGNLASLTDAKDLRGHLTRLMPLIRNVLVSPVPETRAEAARALGVLVERLGEVQFPDLVPSLMAQLRGANVTGVDRQGAAQGLSEVLAALGMDRLEALLPSVLDNTSSPQAHVREGGIALLIYLPGTFGTVRFGPYVSRIITPILNGLADTSDSVREMSMRAGRMIIGSFSSAAIDLLLPELEAGMMDDTPRIRLSSLQLCSELLFRLGGISGKNTLEGEAAEDGEEGAPAEESIVVSNSVQARLRNALGEERFSRTMAAVFCLRQDPAFNVRDAAAASWKAIIVNTAKTIRELLTMIIDLVIRALSTDGEDQREIASRTLGEVTRKLGGSVLESIVPILQERGSDAGSSASVRAGVMLAVQSLLENATEAQLEDHEEALISAVRRGLVDRSSVVREAAAAAFDALQETIGQTAIEEIIPTLLGALQAREEGGDDALADTSLAALREVMRTRADVVFPASLPTLLVTPISAFNARALADLVGLAGTALNKRLGHILGALAKASDSEDQDEDSREAIDEAIESVLSSVNSFDALHQLMMLLLGWVGNVEKDQRKVLYGCKFFSTFATKVAEKGGGRALEDYNADWLRRLVSLLDDSDPVVVEAALPALAACVETMEDPEELVIPLRHTLSSLTDDVPGLAKKDGFGSCSAVFLAGLMSGTGEQKEQAALGLGILVQKADPVAIKPFVTTGLAGPLIRACGERHAAAVKAAIVNTLDVCLKRIPQHLKPFYPQLSRSFLKAVGDPTGLAVRQQAAIALGTLATIPSVRMDLSTLLAGAKSGIRGQPSTTDYPDGSAAALAQVLLHIDRGNVQVEAVTTEIADLVDSAFTDGCSADEEKFKSGLADVLSGLLLHDATLVKGVVTRRILPASTPDAQLASLCIASMMEYTHEQLYEMDHAKALGKIVGEFTYAGPTIGRPAREAKELMKTRNPWAADESVLDGLSR